MRLSPRLTAALRQAFAAVSASLAVMCAGCWMGWPSPSVPKLLHNHTDLSVTREQVSWVVVSLEVGQVLSPLPSSYLADLLGRRAVLLLTAVLFYATWLLAGLASSPLELYVARLLAGVGTGVVFTVVPVYLAEIASVSFRGALCIVFTNCYMLGVLFQFTVGPLVSYKVLAFLSGSITVVFFISFLFMPDSPYFFLMRNRENDARESLRWLRCSKIHRTSSGDLVDPTDQEIVEMKTALEEDKRSKWRLYDLLFTTGNRRATMIVMVLCAFQKLCGISCLIVFSSITLPDWNQLFGKTEIIAVFGLVLATCNFLAVPLVDQLGRRPLLLVSSCGCGVASGCSALFYYLDRETHVDTASFAWLPHACLLCLGVTQSFGVLVVPIILLGEMFPPGLHTSAAAIASVILGVFSFITNKLYLTISNHLGVYANFLFFSVMGFMCAVFSYFFVFETKGKSFVEIQKELRRADSCLR